MSDFPPTPTESTAATAATKRNKSDADTFSGPLAPVQLRIPADLISSLRLLSYQSGRSMSELAIECLTTEAIIAKTWITSRRSAG
jgi:hypothetical protein